MELPLLALVLVLLSLQMVWFTPQIANCTDWTGSGQILKLLSIHYLFDIWYSYKIIGLSSFQVFFMPKGF